MSIYRLAHMGPVTDMVMGPVTDMVRGIITAQVTDIRPTITGRTVITITDHIAIPDTGITVEPAIPAGITENTGTTNMLAIITGVTGNTADIADIAVTTAVIVTIIEITGLNRPAMAPGV